MNSFVGEFEYDEGSVNTSPNMFEFALTSAPGLAIPLVPAIISPPNGSIAPEAAPAAVAPIGSPIGEPIELLEAEEIMFSKGSNHDHEEESNVETESESNCLLATVTEFINLLERKTYV